MYENLIEIIKTPGPLSNKYLNENNLNYYSIINEKNKIKKIKGGNVNKNDVCFLKKYIVLLLILVISYYFAKKYKLF